MTDGFGLFARVQPIVFAAAMPPCAYSTAAAATPDATPAPANTPTQTPPSEPSEDDAQRVALVVTVDLGQDEAEVREKVRERTISGLERGGVLVAEDAESTLLIDVRWVRGTTTDYAVSFRLGRASSDLPEQIESFLCEGCAGAQLLAQLEQKVSEVVPSELAKKPPPKAATVVMKPEAPQPSTTDSPPKRERRDPNLDAMLYAGFAALFPGVGLTSGGVLSLILNKVDGVPHRPRHWAMLGTGVGFTAIGISLIAIPVARWRKEEATARLMPAPGGLVLSGRF